MQNIPQQYNAYRWSDTNAILPPMLLEEKHSSEHGTETLGTTFCTLDSKLSPCSTIALEDGTDREFRNVGIQ